jgi:hypothetical protein
MSLEDQGATSTALDPEAATAEQGNMSTDDFLSQDLPEKDASATETPSDQAGAEDTEQVETGEGATEADEAGEQATETEAEEFQLPSEEERDFTEDVYERAAAHYSKTLKVELDPNDPAHRALLRENILRGQALARQSQAAETESEEEAGKEEAAKTQTEETPQVLAQQRADYLKRIDDYAQTRIVPEVAQEIAKEFLTVLWPAEMKAGKLKVTPELATGLTKFLTKFGVMLLHNEVPTMMDSYVPGVVNSAFPMIGRVHNEAVMGQALEDMAGEKNSAGQLLYPALEERANDGTIARVRKENPWLNEIKPRGKDGRIVSDPVQIAKYQLAAAMKIVGGANPREIAKAVETGKQQNRKAEQTKRLGRLATGESKGQFGKATTPEDEVFGPMKDLGGTSLDRELSKFSKEELYGKTR